MFGMRTGGLPAPEALNPIFGAFGMWMWKLPELLRAISRGLDAETPPNEGRRSTWRKFGLPNC
jgi:hypothetical protein